MMEQKNVILSAKDVEIQFSLRGKKLNAIRKCSLDLYEGETLAIVGESGSGKSVFTKSFVGMLDATDRSPAVRSCLRERTLQNIRKKKNG